MNKNDGPKKNEGRWIFSYVLAIVSIALAINLLMSPSIPSISSIDAPTWLTFWGSYLGGAIGCLPAIAALHHSRQEARRQHEEFLQQQKEAEKDRHFSHLPMLDCTVSHIPPENISLLQLDEIKAIFDIHTDIPGYYWRNVESETLQQILENGLSEIFLFQIENVGLGPTLSTKLQLFSSFTIGTIQAGKSFPLLVVLRHPVPDNLTVMFSFFDMLGWQYQQIKTFEWKSEKVFQEPISNPDIISQHSDIVS